jgi:hypothetical protein
MKKGRSWVAMDVMVFDHPTIQSLTDTQKVAFFMTICKAKLLRRGGEFRDRRHLAGLLGPSHARAIPRLIAEGLLEESRGGLVTISNYSHWQVDATSAERQARRRARIAAESRTSHAVYVNRKNTEKETDTLTNAGSVLSIGEILARGGAK